MISKCLLKKYISALVFSIPLVCYAQDQKQTSTITAKAANSSTPHRSEDATHYLLNYIPPTPIRPSPNPKITDTGGTRSINTPSGLLLTLLAPNTLAHTASEQPTLYWHLSQNTDRKVMFTLIEIDATRPLIEIQIKQPVTRGFHTIHLSDFGIKLQPNKTYEWSISLLNMDEPSSDDIIAKAFLILIKKIKKLNNQNKLESAKIFAESGLWYETLETIMGNHPNTIENKILLEARSNLLQQVGIAALKPKIQ